MYCLYGGSKHQDVNHDRYKTCRAQFKAYKGINTDIFSSFPTHGAKKKWHGDSELYISHARGNTK